MTNDILIQARRGDEEALNKVLRHYNGSVHYQACRQVDPGSTFFDDYMQVGRMALLVALHDANLEREDGFYKYSALVMRSEMLKFSNSTRLVPWHHYTHTHQYLRLKEKLEARTKRVWKMEEVLAKMNKQEWEKQYVRDSIRVEKIRFSTDPVGVRLLESEINEEAEMDVLRDIRKTFLLRLLIILTPHQRDVVRKFYYQNRTADEIAEELGLNRNSVWGSLRLARRRLARYWQLGSFLYAFNTEHFYDVKYRFPKEIWKPGKYPGMDLLVSNYGRVMRINHCHRHDFLLMPRMKEGFYRYQLPYTGSRKTWKVSILNIIRDHFTDEELPVFYERL